MVLLSSTGNKNVSYVVRAAPLKRNRNGQWLSIDIGQPRKESMYTKTQDRNDETMLVPSGEVPNGDLIAIEAGYHRSKSCYTTYINRRNKGSVQAQPKLASNFDKALDLVIDEITPDITNDSLSPFIHALQASEAFVRSGSRIR